MDECECAAPELVVDADRQCTRCKKFIPFESLEDCRMWIDSLRSLSLRCKVCWRGVVRCQCPETRYVRDSLPMSAWVESVDSGQR